MKFFTRRVLRPLFSGAIAAATWAGPGPAAAVPPDETLRNQYPGTPVPGLTAAQQERFDEGAKFFSRLWTAADGLGPAFNASSCATCHHNPLPGGNEFAPARFVGHSPACSDAVGGHSCAQFELDAESKPQPRPLPGDARLRKPQSLFGLGMLEAVPDRDLLALSRAQAKDIDGVRGVPGRTADGRVGRFGWKARFASVADFTSAAFRAEFGMTSAYYPGRGDDGNRPLELEPQALERTSDFIRGLAAPPLTPRGDITDGRALFAAARCTACHVPSLRTAKTAAPPQANRNIYAYTDLLLHDMGESLSDGIAEGTTSGRRFRTPPLWGLNASGPPYLHDGRAKSVTEAILMHDGEAAASVARFKLFSPAQSESVLRFLGSL